MLFSLPQLVLLVKFYYCIQCNASVRLSHRKLMTLHNLRKGSLKGNLLKILILNFEETGALNLWSGTGHKSVSEEVITDVPTAIVERWQRTVAGSRNSAWMRLLDVHGSTLWKSCGGFCTIIHTRLAVITPTEQFSQKADISCHFSHQNGD